MKSEIFAIYDSKAEYYSAPFFTQTIATAIRMFEDIINSSVEHSYNKHPADYTLFHVGQYDDQTCVFHCGDALVNLGTALSFLRVPPANASDLFTQKVNENEKS